MILQNSGPKRLSRNVLLEGGFQTQVPGQKSLCHDQNERTTGTSALTIYTVWKEKMNARKSGNLRLWTHESPNIDKFERTKFLSAWILVCNARNPGQEVLNARKSGYRLLWTQDERPEIFERAKVWACVLSVSDGLDMLTVGLGPQLERFCVRGIIISQNLGSLFPMQFEAPDRPIRKVPMSRPSQTESAYVQTIVRSKLLVPSSCVRSRKCPDHPRPKAYMSRISCVLVQTIVRSKFVRSHTKILVHPCPDDHAFMSSFSSSAS